MLKPWLRLLRLPNLLSVPGDPLAGFFLAGGAGVAIAWPALAGSLLLYAGGLVSNDCFDLAEDRRERPERPLPSGAIRLGSAIMAALLLFTGALALTWLGGRLCGVLATLLLITIISYNAWLKRVRVAGPLAMGLCRGLSVLLGAACAAKDAPPLAGLHDFAAHQALLLGAAGATLYIANVTAIAARETEQREIGGQRWLPFAAVLLCCAALAWRLVPSAMRTLWFFAPLATLLLAATFATSTTLAGAPAPTVVMRSIGRFIRSLVLLQAALCAYGGGAAGNVGALCLLVAWLFFGPLAKRFYAS